MTDRLYYTDPLVRAFEATVMSVTADGARAHVVLDRTAFYPTSGGQPFDTGRLGTLAVAALVASLFADAGDAVAITLFPLIVLHAVTSRGWTFQSSRSASAISPSSKKLLANNSCVGTPAKAMSSIA